jgi:hypothetical protein
MSEGKMNQLHQLVSKGIKDPKKISKELGLPNTKEVHKAIASLVAGMKEGTGPGLDPVNRKAVTKKFGDRKDKDIDNDGDVDDSDEYLHKRRKAISKATGKPKKEDDRSFDKKKVAEAVNYDFLDEASEYILEEGDIDNLSDEQLDEVLKTIATKVGQGIGAVAKAGGRAASAGAKKVANRLSTSGRADAAEKRADKLDKKRADKERERKARESERAAAQQDREDSKNESTELDEAMKFWKVTITKKAGKLFKGQNVVTKARNSAEAIKKGIKQMKGNPALVPGGSVTAELDEGAKKVVKEKNDALYLIYKDKIKAQQVRNFIKKMYRNKTEVEYAPMDSKNFGVSVFSDRGQADKVKKAVDKKFGKPDDFMLESV